MRCHTTSARMTANWLRWHSHDSAVLNESGWDDRGGRRAPSSTTRKRTSRHKLLIIQSGRRGSNPRRPAWETGRSLRINYIACMACCSVHRMSLISKTASFALVGMEHEWSTANDPKVLLEIHQMEEILRAAGGDCRGNRTARVHEWTSRTVSGIRIAVLGAEVSAHGQIFLTTALCAVILGAQNTIHHTRFTKED